MSRSKLRLVFYGDDFTGSTDALEVLAFAGLRCALFLEPPGPQLLERFDHLDAMGVAGDSRAMSPNEMDEHLPSIFKRLVQTEAPIIHYKVCSTFDSAPQIGNIGRVIEIARRQNPQGYVPIIAGTPALGRYCLFGNLFARSGTDGQVYRIDQHPIMSVHPVTPMKDGDLLQHFARQAAVSISRFTYPNLEGDPKGSEEHLRFIAESSPDAILFDSANSDHLTEVGRLLEQEAGRSAPVFVVGSSGVEYALTQLWSKTGRTIEANSDFTSFEPVDRILVVSGSASKLTSAQIEAAIDAGFVELPVIARDLVDGDHWRRASELITERALQVLAEGRSVIIHTARGPADTRIHEMLDAMISAGQPAEDAMLIGGRLLASRLGHITKGIVKNSQLQRIVISGGDTSSHVTQVLGPDALEIAARLAPGAPLCRMISRSATLDGMEIALKGGQMGDVNFFEKARAGTK